MIKPVKPIRGEDYFGKEVKVVIDRPLGSRHPDYPDLVYQVNYGFLPGTKAADGEEIDAYVLGVKSPLKAFSGRVIAVVRRFDDNEDKLVVAAAGQNFTAEEISKKIEFQEKYFKNEIKIHENTSTGHQEKSH